MPPVVDHLLKVEYTVTWAGEVGQFGYHMRKDSDFDITLSDIQGVAAAAAGRLDDVEALDWMNPLATFTQVKVTAKDQDPYLVYELPVAQAGTGQFSYPHQIACVVSLITARTDRRGRGRVYLPFPAGVDSDDVVLYDNDTGLFTNPLQDLCGPFIAGCRLFTVAGVNFKMVVYSATAGATNDVLSVRVGTVPDTQRRRRRDLIESYESYS